MRATRTLAAYLAVAGTSLLSLAVLNLAADRVPNSGLGTFRDYLVRRNG
jgi:hypothetical protein